MRALASARKHSRAPFSVVPWRVAPGCPLTSQCPIGAVSQRHKSSPRSKKAQYLSAGGPSYARPPDGGKERYSKPKGWTVAYMYKESAQAAGGGGGGAIRPEQRAGRLPRHGGADGLVNPDPAPVLLIYTSRSTQLTRARSTLSVQTPTVAVASASTAATTTARGRRGRRGRQALGRRGGEGGDGTAGGGRRRGGVWRG